MSDSHLPISMLREIAERRDCYAAGLPHSSYYGWKRGDNELSGTQIEALANAIGFDVVLIDREKQPINDSAPEPAPAPVPPCICPFARQFQIAQPAAPRPVRAASPAQPKRPRYED
jgi:hypothetical protein